MNWIAFAIYGGGSVLACLIIAGCCLPDDPKDARKPDERIKEVADAVEKAFWGF